MDSDYFILLLSNILNLSFPISGITTIFISIGLLYVSALLSGAEIALQSLNTIDKEKIEAKNSNRYHLIGLLLNNSDETQTSISVWNSFIYICIILFSIYGMNEIFIFHGHSVAIICFIFILPLILLLFGEIIPKIYGQNKPLTLLKKISPFIYLLIKISYPLNYVIFKINTFLNGTIKKKPNEMVSVDELSKVLELTSEELSEEKDMLEGIINLYSKTAAEIMTPRIDIASLDISKNFQEVIDYIVEVEYSRIPVFGENADDIKGILYIKDLLPFLNQKADFEWNELIRPAFFIPESKKIDTLLEEFRTNKNHLAIVVDEYGGTSGIVTMEDILEEIVGEINDEHDDEEEIKFSQPEDNSFLFQGKILLSDFFRITNVDSKIFDKLTSEVDSLAGLILEIKGDFPVLNEIVSFENFSFKILEMDNKRILKVLFKINDPLLENHKED